MITKETIQRWMREDCGGILVDPLHPEVFSGYVRFTPERSAFCLEANERNRQITERSMRVLKEVMRDGYWDDNASNIRFDKDGILSDGQHRLKAGIETNTTFRCMVTWGVKRTAQQVIDRRGGRKLSDDISIEGFKNARRMAAIARIYYLKDNGVTVKDILQKGGKYDAPDVKLYEFFCGRCDEIKSAERTADNVYSAVHGLGINRAVVNILSIAFNEISPEDAKAFWSKLHDGITEFEDDPIMLLRERLIRNSMSKTNKVPKVVMAALVIKAWNFYMRGETVKQLKYTSGGANPEPFPDIYDPREEGGAESA